MRQFDDKISAGAAHEPVFHGYIGQLIAILNRIEKEQSDAIGRAATAVEQCLAQGGIVHTFGTGHAHLLAMEPFYRAGGLSPVNAILEDRITFAKGAIESTAAERTPGLAEEIFQSVQVESKDVAIVISNSGRNAVPVEMALHFRQRGVQVIAITNVTQSKASTPRNPAGRRLYEVADIVIDNCVPAGDSIVSIPGVALPVGPTSTVAGAAIINSIFVQSAAQLAQKGIPVPVLPSANVDNTGNGDQLLRPYYGRVRWLTFDTAR